MTATTRRVGGGWLERRAEGRLLPVRAVLRLHQTIGNREVGRLLQPLALPAPEDPGSSSRWRPVAWIVSAWRRRARG
jgi:hypothetical protein